MDGLSEEWNSEPRSSPPATIASRSNGSRQTSHNVSQSRIPHLAANMRASSNGSFLRPRSTRGIARQKENAGLAERTASSLNVMPLSPSDNAGKRLSSTTIPDRSSSSLSDSPNSVQHYTIAKNEEAETPEWKKKLRSGEEPISDGFDLFSPSKLEGIFKQSSCPIEQEEEEEDDDDSVVVTEKRPWNTLSDSAFPPPSDELISRPTSRHRPSSMDTLAEVEEETDGDKQNLDLSNISSVIIGKGSLRGVVKREVNKLESAHQSLSQNGSPRNSNDPRMRTISGRKEINNEDFSALEDSERSSIRKQALQETLDTDPVELRKRLENDLLSTENRSSSRASDHDVSYGAEQSLLPDENAAEMTSQSLPEDLSMGTQNYQQSILETIAPKRVPSGLNSSVTRKRQTSGMFNSASGTRKNLRSSPPPYRHDRLEDSILSSEDSELVDDSVVHHLPTSAPHSSAGSPLKLFGDRDTYTNNKLMRVLSQFEDEQSELEVPDEAAALRMSTFGQGELDGFGFEKNVRRPTPETQQPGIPAEKIFKDLLHLNDKATNHARERETSPAKERSPKRRRTLLKDEIFVDGTEVEIKLSRIPDGSLAGKKRRDALPGQEAEPASPGTMAARPVIRPSGSRRLSGNTHSRTASATEVLRSATDALPKVAQEIAEELQSFVEKAAETKRDSRVASLATKDYMEEANKVMEFIRARGKPKPVLPEIQEPSELNPDAILDLEIEEDSTKDSFSRPPSREGRLPQMPDRRHAQHDAATANHLKKFRDADDLELLTSTSVLGALHLVDNKASEEAALVPVPEDEPLDIGESFQSDPPGMRILNDNDRKRKYIGSEIETQGSNFSDNMHSDGSKRTIATTSSTGSRGMISQGTVSIPDTVGIMTFDKESKKWIKQNIAVPKPVASIASPGSKSQRHEHSEADPFDGIPDLSFDETGEAGWKKSPKRAEPEFLDEISRSELANVLPNNVKVAQVPAKSSLKSPRKLRQSVDQSRPVSQDSKASKHEELLHNGFKSADIEVSRSHQPRVVTIAFSSPIASEIPYVQPPSLTDTDLDEDDPSLLPLDDEGSVLATRVAPTFDELAEQDDGYEPVQTRTVMGSVERHEQYRAMTLNRRPVSRIEEYDEDQDNQELSLVHIKHQELTPMPDRRLSVRKSSGKKDSSLLCLTPLSEFTLHQVDRMNHPEESFVAERANPKTLRQAHGSQALTEDALVKAITDAEPTELFWEQLRRLQLRKNGLASLHGLKDYCSALEYLDVASNKIMHLTDLPTTIMSLNVASNMLNDLTSWTQLHNLQYVDVSSNQLESLDCFSSLLHLRRLKASKNKIRQIEGILDMAGLVSLDLSGNDIPEVDFRSCELLSLEDLDLSGNNLMHAKNLHCLSRLKYLDLTENLLEEMEFIDDVKLASLETLCLAHNELTTIDLARYPNLQKLNIDNNIVSGIGNLAAAETLTTLSARDQRVKSNLVNDILSTAVDCTELYLSSNSMPEGGLALSKQPNFTLRCLEIASCGLQTLPQGFGDHFPNMRVLNLNFNALADLSSLQGSIKLKQVLVAKNRIKKMRRTCLTLSRLPALQKVDLRDNPLTVGFYAPSPDGGSNKVYQLPSQNLEFDKKWIGLMDETTWLRRHAMELLLVQCCKNVVESGGLRVDRQALLAEHATWEKLMGKGVLRKDDQAKIEVQE